MPLLSRSNLSEPGLDAGRAWRIEGRDPGERAEATWSGRSEAGRVRAIRNDRVRPIRPTRHIRPAVSPNPSPPGSRRPAGPTNPTRRAEAAAIRPARSWPRCPSRERAEGRPTRLPASPPGADSRARRAELQATPPARRMRRVPVSRQAASILPMSTSRSAAWKEAATSRRNRSRSSPAPRNAGALDVVLHRRLQPAEGEVEPARIEVHPGPREGDGLRDCPSRASRSITGPPGKPSPRSFATLSNASPAASSRVEPRSV